MGIAGLLDTHVLVWALTDVGRLSSVARQLIEDRANTLLVSSASAWELVTKHRLGKLPEGESLVRGYRSHVTLLGASELAVSAEHALLAGTLPGLHRDPFDRMLAAQALIEGVAIISMDPALAGFHVSMIW